MSITVDNSVSTQFAAGGGGFQSSPVAWTAAFAVAASATDLIAFVTLVGTAPTGPALTWDSSGTPQSMQLLKTVANTNSNIYIFGLASPHSGTLDFSLSWTGGATERTGMDAISFIGGSATGTQGTDFPNSNSATGNSTAPSVTLTTVAGNMVVALFIDDGNANNHCTPAQTLIYESTIGRVSSASRVIAGSSSQVMSATLDVGASAWSALAVDIAPAAAASQTPYNPWPQLAPMLAQRSRTGWTPKVIDWHRRQRPGRRALLVPDRRLMLPQGFKKAA